MLLRIFILFLPTLIFLPFNHENQQSKVITAFESIETSPQIISLTNNLEINNNGGHLQGIQMITNELGKYIFLTGSSDSWSYVTIVKYGEESKVISVNRLMDKPFKHAGGFQIFENFLAVGIEDNSEKDKSKVCIYDISNPEKMSLIPVAIIEREGEPMRSTAGCVGITNYKDELLIAVGDWDTKHIDFYTGNRNNPVESKFRLIDSVDTKQLEKKNWPDKNWYSYQNINLFNVNNELYMVGLGQNQKSENVADLFLLSNESGDFVLVKIASKKFDCTDDCTFNAGSGVYFKNEKMNLITCGYHISDTTHLNYFSGKE